MGGRILIVDDEPNILVSFSSLLKDEGHNPVTVGTAEAAARRCQASSFDLILLDLQLPGKSGMAFLRELKSDPLAPRVLVISGQADIATALEAVRLGAVDFMEKPVQPEKLIASVSSALALVTADKQRALLVDEMDAGCQIVGRSPAMMKMLHEIDQVAPTDTTVLITGENGTGKELVATRLYLQSKRRDRPFLRVNCPAIPETLFESELFGHRRGAFTGAVRDQPGKFEQADGGTIFLDEIGELPAASQAKLLRVLESGELETIGADETRRVDIRVICATNRNLGRLVEEGKFREDLFFRVSVIVIEVPRLSDRVDDIPLLAGEFLRRLDPSGRTRLSASAIASLAAMRYPGNVRQLKNIIERLTILFPDRTVQTEDITDWPDRIDNLPPSADERLALSERVNLFEKRVIEQTLRECKGNISEAARQLKADRANLSRKIRDMGLKTGDQ